MVEADIALQQLPRMMPHGINEMKTEQHRAFAISGDCCCSVVGLGISLHGETDVQLENYRSRRECEMPAV